jgi:DnaJ like chaperone protein
MSIWSRLGDAIASLAKGEALLALFDRLRTPPERSIAFTIAVIALGAKMAKADGQVSRSEVAAFRAVFHIPKGEEQNAARVFDLARQDVAGFEAYAARIARLLSGKDSMLEEVIEGLFHIAMADGIYHPKEDAFLQRVAEVFAIPMARFKSIRARFVPDAVQDPYAMLGVTPGTPLADIRRAWVKLVKDGHPDRLIARGLPPEAIQLAERRIIALNDAWAEISGRRKAP